MVDTHELETHVAKIKSSIDNLKNSSLKTQFILNNLMKLVRQEKYEEHVLEHDIDSFAHLLRSLQNKIADLYKHNKPSSETNGIIHDIKTFDKKMEDLFNHFNKVFQFFEHALPQEEHLNHELNDIFQGPHKYFANHLNLHNPLAGIPSHSYLKILGSYKRTYKKEMELASKLVNSVTHIHNQWNDLVGHYRELKIAFTDFSKDCDFLLAHPDGFAREMPAFESRFKNFYHQATTFWSICDNLHKLIGEMLAEVKLLGKNMIVEGKELDKIKECMSVAVDKYVQKNSRVGHHFAKKMLEHHTPRLIEP